MNLRILLGAAVLAIATAFIRNATNHKALVRRDRATLRRIRNS